MSHTTSTIVCTAIPPIRLPAARPRLPCAAAETVIASSGRLPAIASSRMPPSSSPRPSRKSSASVAFERLTPASHVAPAPATNTTTSHGVAREDMTSAHFADVYRFPYVTARTREGLRTTPNVAPRTPLGSEAGGRRWLSSPAPAVARAQGEADGERRPDDRHHPRPFRRGQRGHRERGGACADREPEVGHGRGVAQSRRYQRRRARTDSST